MKIKLAKPTLDQDSIVDGSGVRAVLWTQGCPHHCPGCHNPETHEFKAGIWKEIAEVEEEISHLEGQDGITLTGGDPFYQVEACLEIARFAKKKGLNIWCYTGFTFEQLLEMAKSRFSIIDLLSHIDILVDGKFQLEEKSLNLMFRGSRNQRIIDVAQTLKTGSIVEPVQFQQEKQIEGLPKREYMYI